MLCDPSLHQSYITKVVPDGGATPGAMLVCQDVDDLLDELGGRDVISVLGGPDEVIAHLLLVAFFSGILSAMRLQRKPSEAVMSKRIHYMHLQMTSFTLSRLVC